MTTECNAREFDFQALRANVGGRAHFVLQQDFAQSPTIC
jgi:hypothetical protein